MVRMDETGRSTNNDVAHRKRWWPYGASIAVASCIAAAVTLALVTNHKHSYASLLPERIATQATTFDPYFYRNKIPAGYTFDDSRISFDQGVLIVPLAKPGSPAITLTEQAAPANVTAENLQQNGARVSGTAAPATINDIEGRLLGTMIVSTQQGRTLVLLNAPGNADKADLTALLQGLSVTTR